MNSTVPKFALPLITFLVALCSITYEMLLSHTSTILLGGTFFRYIITIGLYILCLGLGSLSREYFRRFNPLKLLISIEYVLAVIGSLLLIVPLLIDGLLVKSNLHLEFVLHFTIYFFVIGIGVTSGLELPLLMEMAEEKSAGGQIQILGIDFLATFLGVVIFPILILPFVGLFWAIAIVSGVNLLVAIYLALKSHQKITALNWVIWATCTALIVCNVCLQVPISNLVFGGAR